MPFRAFRSANEPSLRPSWSSVGWVVFYVLNLKFRSVQVQIECGIDWVLEELFSVDSVDHWTMADLRSHRRIYFNVLFLVLNSAGCCSSSLTALSSSDFLRVQSFTARKYLAGIIFRPRDCQNCSGFTELHEARGGEFSFLGWVWSIQSSISNWVSMFPSLIYEFPPVFFSGGCINCRPLICLAAVWNPFKLIVLSVILSLAIHCSISCTVSTFLFFV